MGGIGVWTAWCGDVLFILYLYFNTLILMCFGGEGMRDDGDDGWFVWGRMVW